MRCTRRTRALAIGFGFALAAIPAAGPRAARADEGVDVNGSAPTEEVGFKKESEEDSAWAEWRKSVSNRYLMGVNSLITAPADPVMSTVKPDEQFNKLPLASVTKYPIGFGQGMMLSLYRASMGTLDVLFAPLTPMKMLSPEPRYMIFPDVKHEEY